MQSLRMAVGKTSASLCSVITAKPDCGRGEWWGEEALEMHEQSRGMFTVLVLLRKDQDLREQSFSYGNVLSVTATEDRAR
ncbi:MAG: hypothetical protein JXA30_22255 [Deltaproteobacteria bacterium]|nr:hypothetical protein [Deltaproteobacteria bacterium]